MTRRSGESNDARFQKIPKRNRKREFDKDERDEDRASNARHATAGGCGRREYRKTAPLSESFRCRKCRAMIGAPPSGTSQRNHCPLCLFSRHVDYRPGDRSGECGSSMEPISIWVRGDEWVLLHRCQGCGVIHANRIAPDDNEIALLSLAAKPLGRPSFPLYTDADAQD